MNKELGTRYGAEPQVGWRHFLKLTGTGVAAGVMAAIDAPVFARTTLAWDKIGWD